MIYLASAGGLPHRRRACGALSLLWLGPDEFLLLAPDETMPRVTIPPPACISTSRTDEAALT